MTYKLKNLDDQAGITHSNILILLDLGYKYSSKNGRKYRVVLGKCFMCESVRDFRLDDLRSNKIKSCGCLKLKSIGNLNRTHGLSKTRQYKCWQNMKNRCDNPKNKSYKNYGGIGITYEDNWKSFDCFWQDMGESYQENLELDRIDVHGNYSKENCRWVSESEQAFNQRLKFNNTSGVSGVSFCNIRKMWRATIGVKRVQIELGYYLNFELAHLARKNAEIHYFGYCKSESNYEV